MSTTVNIHMNPSAKALLTALAFSALTLATPVFAASSDVRHAVNYMDGSRPEADASAAKTLLYQDTALASDGLPCGEFYAIANASPASPAASKDSPLRTAWMWAGAGGAVVAAGVAAWIFLSEDEPGPMPMPVHAILP